MIQEQFIDILEIMKLKTLLESPLNIPDLDWHDLENPTENAKLYKNFISKEYQYKKAILKLTETAIIYQMKTELFCLDSERQQVTYYMKYSVDTNKILGQYVWQSLVWVDKELHYDYLKDIPAKIFFENLLTKFKTIITDSEQTWHGRRFWEYRIVDALKKNLNVYFFNFENKHIEKMFSFNQLYDFQKKYDIWGNSPKHKMKRMVISNKNLI